MLNTSIIDLEVRHLVSVNHLDHIQVYSQNYVLQGSRFQEFLPYSIDSCACMYMSPNLGIINWSVFMLMNYVILVGNLERHPWLMSWDKSEDQLNMGKKKKIQKSRNGQSISNDENISLCRGSNMGDGEEDSGWDLFNLRIRGIKLER